VKNPNGSIILTTAGYVLKKYQNNLSELSKFSYIILDEVHERTIDYDLILLFIQRNLLSQNPNLRVILMSATPNLKLYHKFFQPYSIGEYHSKFVSDYEDEYTYILTITLHANVRI